MTFVLQVALPANPRLLPKTRQALAGYLEEIVPEPEDLHDVILALDEACANVVRHAFPGQSNGTYELRAEVGPDEIRVTVEDHGVGLHPSVVNDDGPCDTESTSGRGLHIIRSVMTDVDVEAAGPHGGTRILMRKRLS